MGAIEHQDCSFLQELHLLLPDPRDEVTALGVSLAPAAQLSVDQDGNGRLVVVY